MAFALAFVACNEDSPTIPDPVVIQPSVPEQQEVTPTVIVVPQEPNSDLPVWVKCNPATGVCTFTSDKPRPVNAVCTYPGQNHPIWGTWEAVVNTGDTVNAVDICTDVPGVDEERCVPITKPVQIDFHGAGRHIGHLGPIYDLTFPANLSKEECEACIEWKEPKTSTKCGDFNECHEHPTASTVNGGQCSQEKKCVETTTWNCKDPTTRPFEDVQPCECECGEWDEPVITRERDPGEWGACEPRLTASSGGGAECKRWREVVFTVTRTWNCKEPEIKTETKRESEACECPTDPKLCHISNQGGPGDTNFNLILTPADGHAHHSIANGFCPGDLLVDDCTCEGALAAAKTCGDPAAGGFVCKDNRN
jgi:hypothetical protein